jgi:hypothetical protein
VGKEEGGGGGPWESPLPPSLRSRGHPAAARVAARRGAVAPGVGGSPEPPQENDAGVGYVF